MQIRLEEFTGLFAPWAGGALYCGFSGGADSTAALLVTQQAAERFGFTVTAVHVNHRLRGAESEREAAAAEKFCRERGIAFRKFDLTYEAGEKKDENALREKRLAIWRMLAGGKKHTAVVLGHHADDAAENLLLKWGRGGNVSSLTAPGMHSMPGGVVLLRPLWEHSRAEVEEFLLRNGVTKWAVDSSNLEETHTLRNRLRLELLPQLYRLHPGFREGVRRSMKALAADAECLDALAKKKAAAWKKRYPGGIPACLWAKEMEALRFRLLKELTGTAELTAAAAEEFDRLLRLPASPETRRMAVPGAKRMLLLKDGVVLLDAETPKENAVWEWRKEPEIICGRWHFTAIVTDVSDHKDTPLESALFDAETLPERLLVSPLQAGEKMMPFGRDNMESVKKLRTDRKVAAFEAPPALRTGDGTILWAPKIRHGAHFSAREGKPTVKMEISFTEGSVPHVGRQPGTSPASACRVVPCRGFKGEEPLTVGDPPEAKGGVSQKSRVRTRLSRQSRPEPSGERDAGCGAKPCIQEPPI